MKRDQKISEILTEMAKDVDCDIDLACSCAEFAHEDDFMYKLMNKWSLAKTSRDKYGYLLKMDSLLNEYQLFG